MAASGTKATTRPASGFRRELLEVDSEAIIITASVALIHLATSLVLLC